MDYCIQPPEELIEARVQLPLSKSFANRLLVIKAIMGKPMNVDSSASEDIKALAHGIESSDKHEVNIGAAGTAMRFLLAYYAAKPGTDIILDGSDRMRRRPVKILVEALKELGADIEYTAEEGFPPVKIKGKKLEGGSIRLRADVSSQYTTALMLIGPMMAKGLTITLEGEPVSTSYIKMTAAIMRDCGIDAEITGNEIEINSGIYHLPPKLEDIDWTAASYWAEIVALSAGFISLPGLDPESNQGDVKMLEIFNKLGVDHAELDDEKGLELMAHPEVHSRIDLDLSDNPDLAQTVIVTCILLNIPFNICGLSTLRIKETDRLEALKTELLKFGCMVEIDGNDTLRWDGKTYPIHQRPIIETYSDHRMAMSFAPAAILLPGIVIKDADVVNKSYPGFWDDLRSAGFSVEEFKEETPYQE